MHNELVFHKVKAIRPGLKGVANHVIHCKKKKNRENKKTLQFLQVQAPVVYIKFTPWRLFFWHSSTSLKYLKEQPRITSIKTTLQNVHPCGTSFCCQQYSLPHFPPLYLHPYKILHFWKKYFSLIPPPIFHSHFSTLLRQSLKQQCTM